MGVCQANCADLELIPVPDGGCGDPRRKRSLYRLLFYKCSTELPDPLTCESLNTLIESNAVVVSNPLSQVEWADPEMEEFEVADCLPVLEQAVGRQLTFQDRIKVDVPEGPSGSPAASPFADLKFWGTLQEAKVSLRVLVLWCDGVIEQPKDDQGKPMPIGFNVFRAFERQGTGNSSYTLEIKKGVINFKGDPLALTGDYAPALVVEGATCETLAAKLGL